MMIVQSATQAPAQLMYNDPTRTQVWIITCSGRDCRNVPRGTYIVHFFFVVLMSHADTLSLPYCSMFNAQPLAPTHPPDRHDKQSLCLQH